MKHVEASKAVIAVAVAFESKPATAQAGALLRSLQLLEKEKLQLVRRLFAHLDEDWKPGEETLTNNFCLTLLPFNSHRPPRCTSESRNLRPRKILMKDLRHQSTTNGLKRHKSACERWLRKSTTFWKRSRKKRFNTSFEDLSVLTSNLKPKTIHQLEHLSERVTSPDSTLLRTPHL